MLTWWLSKQFDLKSFYLFTFSFLKCYVPNQYIKSFMTDGTYQITSYKYLGQ